MNRSTQKTETPPISPVPIPRKGIPGFAGALLYIMIGLSALMIPVGIMAATGSSFLTGLPAEGISLLYLILLAVYFGRTAKLSVKASRGITPMMIAGSIFFYLTLRSLIPAAVCFALIFTIGEGSVLMATAGKRQVLLIPLAPLVACGVAAFLFSRIDIALLSLLPFPAALALAAGTRSSAGRETGLTRVGALCFTSVVLGVTLLGFAAWFLYQAIGTLELSALTELLEQLRSTLTQALLNYQVTYGDTVILSFTDQEEVIVNAVNSTINILPAVLVVLLNMISAVAQMLALSGLQAYGFGASATPRTREFRISAVSAAVFLLSWIVALVAVGENSSSTVASTVGENLFIILIPGLALAGVFRLMRFMARRGSRLGCGFILLLMVVPCLLAYAPPLLAFYEAVSSIFGPLWDKWRQRKSSSDDHDTPNHSDKGERPLSDQELFERYCREREKEKQDRDRDDKD